MNIQELSTSERILLAQQLWDSVRTKANEIDIGEGQQKVLEERLAALEADANPGDSWKNVKSRIVNS